MKYDSFFNSIDMAVKEFKKRDKSKVVRVISHLDSDGISACSIMIHALNLENISYSISILPQLDKDNLKEFSKEKYQYFIFTDLGSGQIEDIATLLKEKKVIILDHHQISDKTEYKNITHINPHLNNITGSNEISGSGVVYFFAKTLNNKNTEMVHIALVGAIGDSQEDSGFVGLNKIILQEAEKTGKIQVEKGLKLFGSQTKPLYKIIQYSTNPFIPGVTGNEKNTLNFLKELKINPKVGNTWKKLKHLSDDEKQRLIDGIIKRRRKEKKPDDVYGNLYILPDEEDESPLREAKEFSTVLNACGRLNKSSLGIGACLGHDKIKKKAIDQLKKYKHEILSAMHWYLTHKSKIIRSKGHVIIDSEDKILPTIIGTTCSIISKSGEYEDNTFVLAVGKRENDFYKASLRICGNNVRKDINLKDIIQKISSNIEGCVCGGHKNASGTLIPSDKKELFIREAINIFSQYEKEEFIEDV